MTLSLAFETSLDACMRSFLKEDYIDDPTDKKDRYKCQNCRQRTRAKIKTDISKRPLVQVFHIKRFQFPSMNKITTKTKFPLVLDFNEYCGDTCIDL